MKKILCACLLSVFVFLSGCGSATEETVDKNVTDEKTMDGVFRYANWGDSKETIISIEGEPYIVDDTQLVYIDVPLMTYKTVVGYFFNNKGFEGGIYTITDQHTNNQEYINDFKNVKNSLSEKYGNPYKESEEWLGDLYKDDPGMALYFGNLKYLDIYEGEDGLHVAHSLSCDNFKINHTIVYTTANKKVDKSGL